MVVNPVFITQNSYMKELYAKIEKIALSDATVLITGESGTGKEVISQLIHYRSPRNNEQFIAVNCGAIPRELIESELFGHERGAFTGAVDRKSGCFELADKGTIFFDEIGEMDLDIQVKLLRVVESQNFRRIGGSREISVDTRIVAATNKNLRDAIENDKFREDLFYRLSIIEIELPPLRNRIEDIPVLIDHYINMFSIKYRKNQKIFNRESMDKLMSYSWPGNIRELRNVIERLVVIVEEDVIDVEHLPLNISHYEKPAYSNGSLTIPLGTSIEDVEKKLIHHTLTSVGNNKSEAARILGFSRQTLHNKLNDYGIECI